MTKMSKTSKSSICVGENVKNVIFGKTVFFITGQWFILPRQWLFLPGSGYSYLAVVIPTGQWFSPLPEIQLTAGFDSTLLASISGFLTF